MATEHKIPAFTVQSVSVGKPIPKATGEDPVNQSWMKLGPVDGNSQPEKDVVYSFNEHNMFAKMIHTAFYSHYPLAISPDVIWLTIMQGFAIHVRENAEKLREKFVDFDGKKTLAINRPSFVPGSRDNDWPSVFPEFEQLIAENIGRDTAEMIRSDFSTTTPTDRIAGQIVLMDCVESYFSYVVRCGCGIPSIQLTGVPEDWQSIRKRLERLRTFDLDWWVDELAVVLDEFVAAADGKPSETFWRSICNLCGASGMRQPINGWMQVFFPYLTNGVRQDRSRSKVTRTDREHSAFVKNEYLGAWRKSVETNSLDDFERGWRGGKGCGYGVKLKSFPTSISSVPFKLEDSVTGQTYDMRFCAGLTSISQSEDGSLRCNTGWAVLQGSDKIRINSNRKL